MRYLRDSRFWLAVITVNVAVYVAGYVALRALGQPCPCELAR